MGACTSSKKSPQTSGAVAIPKPQEKLPIDTTEIYHFLVTITKLKVRGVPHVISTQDTYYLQAEWTPRVFTTEKREGEKVQWDDEWSFRTQTPICDMQANYFSVSLITAKGDRTVAQVFISLWDIATGPSYQNFALVDAKQNPVGRLGVDVKVLQETEIKVNPLTVKCSFLHEDVGRYSLNIRYAELIDTETAHSLISESPSWVFASDSFDPQSCLQLSFLSTIESLQTASLQFRVWKHRKAGEEKTLVAECWIGFNKLLKDERFSALRSQLSKSINIAKEQNSTPTIDTIVHQNDAKLEREFQEKLWFNGKHIGSIAVNLVICNFPFIGQLIAGVNSEDGVRLQSTTVIDSKNRTKIALPQAVVEIASAIEKLREHVQAKSRGVVQIRGPQVRSHIKDVEELIRKLKETEKETMIAHVYKSEGELIEAQGIFLELGEYLIGYADAVAYEVKAYYFDCLSHLIKRGELDLGHVSLEGTANTVIREKKLAIAKRYKGFLRKLLILALAKMNLKGVDAKVQEFSEIVMAVAYFRIPEFKDRIVGALKKKSFETVPEWRGTTFDLEEDVTTHSEFLPMFNWQQFFYSFIPMEYDPKYELAIQEDRWQKRIEKRGLAYFRFVSEWATDVKRIFVHKQVPYSAIPGYNVILKSFLLELKERKVTEIPEAMITASKALLNNREVVSVFVLILFQKTDIRNFEMVMETYRITNEWLTFLYEKGLGLPTNFNHHVLIKALKMTLCDELSLNIANSLWLLYRTYHILHSDVKREVVLQCVLGSEAQRLMLHWSEIIRSFFWTFVLYRAKSLRSVPIEPLSKVDEDILARSEVLIQSLDDLADDMSEKVGQDLRPYIEHSKKELAKKMEEFERWEESKRGGGGGKGKYGTFRDFPFPDVDVEIPFQDEVEKKLEEEW